MKKILLLSLILTLICNNLFGAFEEEYGKDISEAFEVLNSSDTFDCYFGNAIISIYRREIYYLRLIMDREDSLDILADFIRESKNPYLHLYVLVALRQIDMKIYNILVERYRHNDILLVSKIERKIFARKMSEIIWAIENNKSPKIPPMKKILKSGGIQSYVK